MNTSRILAGIAVFFGVGVFAATLVHATYFAPDISGINIPANERPITAATSSLPVRLQIPVLSIDAKVQYVGINGKGNVGVPNNFTDVAWYKLGTVPGQLGSAVIDGHVDNGLSLAGVFKHLGDIHVGDDEYIVTEGGTRLHFVVTDIKTYPYKNAPADYIFSRTDKARLVLITCEGNWVKADKTYDQRLVVFAELQKS